MNFFQPNSISFNSTRLNFGNLNFIRFALKFSTALILSATLMSALNAKGLDEAIKNVDVSGVLRYRYEAASWGKDASLNGNFGENRYGILDSNAPHRFRAFVSTAIDAGDGFKVIGQLMYNDDTNGGWARDAQSALTTTKQAVVLKQAYLRYDLADIGISLLLGKQELGTIWTDDFTGIAAKVLINPTDGLSFAAFAVDSFEGESGDVDAAKIGSNGAYDNNLYGVALMAGIAGFDAQIWGAYWDKVATLYAANLKYTLVFGGNHKVGAKATYLGSVVASDFKERNDEFGNAELIDGRLFGEFGGLDMRVGGIFFGDKKKTTFNTIEDTTGADLYIGREMFYADKTALVFADGQSAFGYVGVGYTLGANVRVGVQGVFGKNTQELDDFQSAMYADLDELEDTRYEAVFELGWQANEDLSFEGWYSYLNSTTKKAKYPLDATNTEDLKQNKQTIRLQAKYKF